MTNILKLSLVCLAIVIASLFLPYMEYDIASGGWFQPVIIEEFDLNYFGLELVGSYISLIMIGACTAITALSKTRTTAIISFIFALILAIYTFLFGVYLSSSFFFPGNTWGNRIQIGFALNAATVGFYLILSFWHLRKTPRGLKNKDSDQLLDYF